MDERLVYVHCPICGKELINLGESSGTYWYWCCNCKIEFDVTLDEESK